MVEIKTERTYRFEDGVPVAIKKDVYVNAKGCQMTQILEEKGISLEDAREVLEIYAPEELDKINEEIKKKEKEVNEFKDICSQFENTREFIKFKEYVQSDEYKNHMSNLNKLSALKTGQARLIELEKSKEDILNWGTQMGGIIKGLENGSNE